MSSTPSPNWNPMKFRGLCEKRKQQQSRNCKPTILTSSLAFFFFLTLYSIPLVFYFWSPYWLKIKHLAKIDWCLGSEAYCPLSLWSLRKSKTDEKLEAQENIFSLELLGICNKLLRQLGSYECMAGANLEAFIGLSFPWYYWLNQ